MFRGWELIERYLPFARLERKVACEGCTIHLIRRSGWPIFASEIVHDIVDEIVIVDVMELIQVNTV